MIVLEGGLGVEPVEDPFWVESLEGIYKPSVSFTKTRAYRVGLLSHCFVL